jgi:hypothetical protein
MKYDRPSPTLERLCVVFNLRTIKEQRAMSDIIFCISGVLKNKLPICIIPKGYYVRVAVVVSVFVLGTAHIVIDLDRCERYRDVHYSKFHKEVV